MISKMKIVAVRAVKILAKLYWMAVVWLMNPILARDDTYTLRRLGRKLMLVYVSRDFAADKESAHTLNTLTSLMADIPYFVYKRTEYEWSLAIMSEYRTEAMSRIRKSPELKRYYIAPEKHHYNTNPVVPIGSLKFGLHNDEDIIAASIYRHVGAKDSQRFIEGALMETRVEFWSKPEHMDDSIVKRSIDEAGILDSSALEGSIIAPVANGFAKVFSPDSLETTTVTVGDVEHPSYEIFNRPTLNSVNFPIDLVYTWVDGGDPKWFEKYKAARTEVDPAFANNTMSRYTSHDELRYALRSVQMFAPWVRNIFIVTDEQIPSWLDLSSESKVKVIDHKDIFTDKDVLPVFNSHAIETQIDNIPGLSEHYLYLNDDMFFANPVTPEQFYFPNGIAKVQPSPATIGTGAPIDGETAPSSAGKNARKVIDETFGVYVSNKYKHAAYPQRKSLAKDIKKKNKELVDKTMASKFRDKENIPFTSTLMQTYLIAAQQGVATSYRSATIDVSKNTAPGRLKELLSYHNYIIFCLNESQTAEKDEAKVDKRVRSFLSKYFSYEAEWEKK